MLNNNKSPDHRSRALHLGLRSSELRSLVYYVQRTDIGLINFNLFQKNIPIIFYMSGLVLSEFQAVNFRSPIYYSLS